jgi:hypothetical protein
MSDARQDEENLDALLQEWNLQLDEWHAQIALMKAPQAMPEPMRQAKSEIPRGLAA